MKLKDILTDIKTYIVLALFIIGIGVAITGWAKLPEKVAKVEEKIDKTDDKVQSVATTLEKYIEVQAVKDIEEEKSEKAEKELMFKWIAEVSKK